MPSSYLVGFKCQQDNNTILKKTVSSIGGSCFFSEGGWRIKPLGHEIVEFLDGWG